MEKGYYGGIGLLVIILIILLVVLLSAPKSNSGGINVAAIVFLTGDQASLGEEINNGFIIAKQDFERNNNISLDLRIEDSGDEPQRAISAYQKLKGEGYSLIISTGDAIMAALTPLAAEDKIVLFNTVSASQDISNEWMFRGWITSAQQGKPIARLLKEHERKKIAILKLNNIYSTSFVSSLKSNLDRGIDIVSEESYNILDNDVKTQIIKVRESNPDAIVVTGFGPAYPIVFQQIRQLGINKPIYSDGTISIPYFFGVAGGYSILNNTYFVATEFDASNPSNQKITEFVSKYSNVSQFPPSFTAAFGYDALMVAANTIHTCKGQSSEGIRTCLSQVNYNGILGENLSFGSDGEMNIPIYIKQYINGETVFIKRI